ncbi:unnamed protein product, partial [marine sediment metagenome]
YKYYKKTRDKERIAGVLNGLGIAYFLRFNFQGAINCYKKVIQISDTIGDQFGVATASCNLANVFNDRGYHLMAVDCFQRALTISKKIGNSLMIGASLLGLAETFIKLSNYKKVKEYSEKAIEIFQSLGWREKIVPPTHFIGMMHQAMGNYTSGLRFYRRALRISEAIDNHQGLASSLVSIGSLFIDIGAFSKAKLYINSALKTAATIKMQKIEVDCYIHLCRMNLMMVDYLTAIGFYKEGVKKAKEIGEQQRLLRLLLIFSEICYYREQYRKGFE